jgi:hypothetical protein
MFAFGCAMNWLEGKWESEVEREKVAGAAG